MPVGLLRSSSDPSAPPPRAAPPSSFGPPRPVTPKIRRRRRAPVGTIALALLVVLAATVAVGGDRWGWFGSPSGSTPAGACPAGLSLAGEGASLVLPLVSTWGSGFQSALGASAPVVNYDPAGAGAGITAITDRSVDFGATDEPLSEAEYNALPGVLTLPIAVSAVAVVYDLPGVEATVELNSTLLSAIFLGEITEWNDPRLLALNPSVGLPMQPILTVHRADAAGTSFVLTTYLSEGDAAWAGGPGVGIQPSWPSAPSQKGETGDSALAKYVAATPYSIGYAGLSDAAGVSGLQRAALENPAGRFVAPSPASAGSAADSWLNRSALPSTSPGWSNVSLVNAAGPGDYPLTTFSYFLVYSATGAGFEPSGPKAMVLVQWLSYSVGPGQVAADGLGFAPLPGPIVAWADRAIGSMTFGGHSVPSCTLG